MGKDKPDAAASQEAGLFGTRAALAKRLGVSVAFIARRAAKGRLWKVGAAGYHRKQAAIIEAVLAGAYAEDEGEKLWAAHLELMRGECG